MSSLRWLVMVGLTSVLACSPPVPKTCAMTCGGCCTAAGECETGLGNAACGREGGACTSCGRGSSCSAGVCSGAAAGGRAGGAAFGGGDFGGGTSGGFSGGFGGGSFAGGFATSGGFVTSGGSAGGDAGGSAGGTTVCSTTTCTGCCDARGVCVNAPDNRLDSSCGSNGFSCADCARFGSVCTLIDGANYGCFRSTGGGAAGGSTAGGSTSGGSTAGGSSAGGSTAGGSTAGGSTAGGSTGGGSTAGGAGGGNAGTPVTGSVITRHYLADGGTTTTPINLTSSLIQAFVAIGGGNYSVLPGTGTSSGTFSIPNVPVGTVLVRVDSSFLETTARAVTFTTHEQGRPNATVATTEPTPLTVAVSNMQPWFDGADQLVWLTPNLGQTFFNMPLSFPPPNAATSTEIGANFNGLKLTSQPQGDETWLLQTRFATDGGWAAQTTVSARQIPPFTHQDGQSASLSAVMQFAPTLPVATPMFGWNLNAFTALQSSLPSGSSPRGFLAFSPCPSPTPNTLSVFDLWSTQVLSGQPPPTGASFVQPFPPPWNIVGRAFFLVDTLRQATGTTGPANFISGFGHYDTLNVFTTSFIAPRLGPARNLMLNGTAFTMNRPGASTAPTFSWTAPMLGTPTTYFVTLTRLSSTAGQPTTTLESFIFSTAATTFQVPAGLLLSGQPYVAEVEALEASFNARTEFATRQVPSAVSVIVSPILIP